MAANHLVLVVELCLWQQDAEQLDAPSTAVLHMPRKVNLAKPGTVPHVPALIYDSVSGLGSSGDACTDLVTSHAPCFQLQVFCGLHEHMPFEASSRSLEGMQQVPDKVPAAPSASLHARAPPSSCS